MHFVTFLLGSGYRSTCEPLFETLLIRYL